MKGDVSGKPRIRPAGTAARNGVRWRCESDEGRVPQ
jgi:hypothetical protein